MRLPHLQSSTTWRAGCCRSWGIYIRTSWGVSIAFDGSCEEYALQDIMSVLELEQFDEADADFAVEHKFFINNDDTPHGAAIHEVFLNQLVAHVLESFMSSLRVRCAAHPSICMS